MIPTRFGGVSPRFFFKKNLIGMRTNLHEMAPNLVEPQKTFTKWRQTSLEPQKTSSKRRQTSLPRFQTPSIRRTEGSPPQPIMRIASSRSQFGRSPVSTACRKIPHLRTRRMNRLVCRIVITVHGTMSRLVSCSCARGCAPAPGMAIRCGSMPADGSEEI